MIYGYLNELTNGHKKNSVISEKQLQMAATLPAVVWEWLQLLPILTSTLRGGTATRVTLWTKRSTNCLSLLQIGRVQKIAVEKKQAHNQPQVSAGKTHRLVTSGIYTGHQPVGSLTQNQEPIHLTFTCITCGW